MVENIKLFFRLMVLGTLAFICILMLPLSSPEKNVSDYKFLVRQTFRRIKVKEMCDQLQQTCPECAPPGDRPVLYFLREAHLGWCPVFKAGSTKIVQSFIQIWKHLNNSVATFNTSQAFIRHLNRFTTKSLYNFFVAENDDLDLRLFMVTRHPFDRLVSAFRDKLERFKPSGEDEPHGSTFYYNVYGKKMVEKYRERAINKFGQDYFRKRNFFGAPVNPLDKRNTSDLPIFWEFVRMIIEERDLPHAMNEHWSPQHRYCSPCNVNYDFVIKFEEFEREMAAMWSILGVKKFMGESYWNHDQKSIADSRSISRMYFQTLSDEDIRNLYDIYKYDFEIFGYDWNPSDLI